MVGSLYGFHDALIKVLALAGILLVLFVITVLTRKHIIKKRYFVYLAIFIQLVYLGWRIGFTMPPLPSPGSFLWYPAADR